MRSIQTHCPYCALQCAMNLTVTEESKKVDVTVTGTAFPTNRGRLCRKGSTAGELLERRDDRLTSPLRQVRDATGQRTGRFEEVTWEEALEGIGTEVTRLQEKAGRDSVGVFGSGGLTNEKTYSIGKFARVGLRTSQIDYNGQFCMSSASKASTMVFGLDRGLPFPLTDLDSACTILLLGSNVADTMPPFVQHLESARQQGGLIVIDPRRSNTAELTADGAGLHMAPTPGSDLILLLAAANVILEEDLADAEYLNVRVNGLSEFRRSVSHWWPERAQSFTGIGADQIRFFARKLGYAALRARHGGAPVYVLTGRGVEQHRDGTDTTRAAISLALLLGLPGAGLDGTRRGGYGTLTGQGNGQGGREMGQKADQLPGMRMITNPKDRAHIASVWGVDAADIPGPGKPATQLLHTMGTPHGVSGLFVHGANIAISAPDSGRVIRNMRALELLVVADFFMSETAKEADYVLPVLQWAEEDGTMTNLEGRVLRRRKAVQAPPGPRSELWIWAELASRLGSPSQFCVEPEEVFEEIRRATRGAWADYSGLQWKLIDEGYAPYWPVSHSKAHDEHSSEGEPIIGTARMFEERFAHADGKAELSALTPGERPPLEVGELIFTTGRVMEHYQSGTQTRRVQALNDAVPHATVQIHPAVASENNLSEGDHAVIENNQGQLIAKVEMDSDIRADTIFSPFHFPDQGTANLLTRGLLDPHSSMPEFKATSVRVRQATAAEIRGLSNEHLGAHP